MVTKKAAEKAAKDEPVADEPDDGIVGGFPTGELAGPSFTADEYEALAAEIPGATVEYHGKEPVGITVPYPLAQRLRS